MWPTKLDEYRGGLERAISSLNMDSLLTFVQRSENLEMDVSHPIILIKRQNVDDLLKFTIQPISLSVKRLLKERLVEAEQEERLLRTHSRHCGNRGRRVARFLGIST
jgi:hypothetical protein